MKSIATCFICGQQIEYQAGYHHTVDCDLYGGPICPLCKSRGLNHFLGKKKSDLQNAMKEEMKNYAKKIKDSRVLLGDWWQKDSTLYQHLIEGEK